LLFHNRIADEVIIKTNLSYQPTVITINRKPCRDDGTNNRKEFLEVLDREKVDVFLVDFDDLKQELARG
jgi:hypothetical protein